MKKWDNSQLKSFLDNYLKQSNLFPDELIKELESVFTRTSALLVELLSETALWLPRERKAAGVDPKWIVYETPTKVLYDTLMYVLSGYIDDSALLLSKKKEISVGLQAIFKEKSAAFKGRFNKNDITGRIEIIQNYFDEVLST